MRNKLISLLKKSTITKKVYYKLTDKVPFIENLLSLYRYSKWMDQYRAQLVDTKEDFYFSKYKQLCAKSIVNHNRIGLQRPVIIMTTYNDHDIIEAILNENDRLGYDQIVIDNWSTDGTWEIINQAKTGLKSILDIMQYPFDGPTEHYQWKAMLDLKSEIALNYKGRWILHQDSDEITISPLANSNIAVILKSIEELGYNCISLRMLDFAPIDNSFTRGNPVEHFKYYRISNIPSYGLQNKIWLQGETKVDLSHAGGHDVAFEGRTIFPIRLPRFHYSIRSVEHAKSKYSPKRLTRSESERTTLGWHTHVEVKLTEEVIIDKSKLIEFKFSDLYSEKFRWFMHHD